MPIGLFGCCFVYFILILLVVENKRYEITVAFIKSSEKKKKIFIPILNANRNNKCIIVCFFFSEKVRCQNEKPLLLKKHEMSGERKH